MTLITALESDAEHMQRNYSAQHLEFRSSIIEPLPDDGVFEVSTPAGSFRMTKAEFHATFPEIVNSVSYRDRGSYHYPKLPYKVFRFLVRERKGGDASLDGPVDARVDQVESDGPDPHE
jgi:hypothetical protein